MVIKIKLYTTDGIETKYYRDVKPFDYGSYVAGFYANRDMYQGGTMSKIRGTSDEIVHDFGKVTGYPYQKGKA